MVDRSRWTGQRWRSALYWAQKGVDMANTSAEADIRRAKAIRAMKKGVRDPEALNAIDDAAARLEKRAGKKLKKVGRKGRARRIGTISSV